MAYFLGGKNTDAIIRVVWVQVGPVVAIAWNMLIYITILPYLTDVMFSFLYPINITFTEFLASQALKKIGAKVPEYNNDVPSVRDDLQVALVTGALVEFVEAMIISGVIALFHDTGYIVFFFFSFLHFFLSQLKKRKTKKRKKT